VQGLTWWDFVDGGWLNSPAGLLRRDASPKPAYEALHNLIKGEWWLPPTTMMTDAEGTVQFTGFLGDYEISCQGKATPFSLNEAGTSAINVRVP
jgi:hypothetical protein